MNLNQFYEEAIVACNLNGKYQKILFCILAAVAFSCSMIITGFPSQKEIPSFVCLNRLDFQENLSEFTEYRNDPLRFKVINEEKCIAHYCSKKESFESAQFWVLIADYKSVRNFVTHLDIMCELETYSGDFTRWVFMGRIVTTVLFSYISDTYGRRTSWLIILFLLTLSNLLFLIVSNKTFYLLIGFLSNMCMSNYNLSMIISVEVMNSDLYSVFNGVVSMFFAACGFFSIFIMWLFKDWFVLLLIHVLIDGVFLYLSYKYFYETPYFCLNKKKYDKLEEVLVNISKINGTYENLDKSKLDQIEIVRKSFGVANRKIYTNTSPYSPEVVIIKLSFKSFTSNFSELNILNSNDFDNQGGNQRGSCSSSNFLYTLFKPYMTIFYKRKPLGNLLKLTLPFITINFVFYGQIMFIERLPGDAKTNSFLLFFSQIVAPILVGWLLQFMGRKRILFFFLFCSIVLSGSLTQIRNQFQASLLLFLNSFSINVCFVVSYVFAVEVFPTSIKTSACGLLILIGNFSLVIGDLLMSIFPSPFYLFALFCLGSIFSISNIEETYKEINTK